MPLIVISLLACAPQDAEMDVSYAFFMANDTSDALADVRLRNKFEDQKDLIPVDCRALEDETQRLAGADPACAGVTPSWFSWLGGYDFYVKEGKLSSETKGEGELWRTEAVLTSEGDLQLTAHGNVGDFGDFRFGWTINPDFQPKVCVGDETGASLEDVDGAWLENWSAADDGYTVWHLNTNSYQINPNNTEDYWFFPQEWAAGYSFGRFGDEPLVHTGTFYNTYADVGIGPLYFPGSAEALEPAGDGTVDGFPSRSGEASVDSWATSIQTYLTENNDITRMAGVDFTPNYRVHSNSWRAADELEPGIDNWVEIPMGYVRIKNGADLTAGKSSSPKVEGDFQLYLVGEDSASRMLIQGSFKIYHIDENTAYTPLLEDVKKEENGTAECK